MGLAMSVGMLAFLRHHDPEGYESLRKQLNEVNRLLGSKKLPLHKEPEELCELKSRARVASHPYEYLHYLRRAVAHALCDEELTPLKRGKSPRKDPFYQNMLDSNTSHIISHSDCEGYYVPVEFARPLYDPLPDKDDHCISGSILGSSQGAMEELVLTAPLLGIELVDGQLSDDLATQLSNKGRAAYSLECQMWLHFFEMTRLSIEHRTAIVFG